MKLRYGLQAKFLTLMGLTLLVVLALVALLWFGVLDGPLLVASAAATVPVALGMALGQLLRRRISEQRFHKLVLVVLLASGGTMIWRAFS